MMYSLKPQKSDNLNLSHIFHPNPATLLHRYICDIQQVCPSITDTKCEQPLQAQLYVSTSIGLKLEQLRR